MTDKKEKKLKLRVPKNHFEKILALSERIKLLKEKAPNSELVEIDFFEKALSEFESGEILIQDKEDLEQLKSE